MDQGAAAEERRLAEVERADLRLVEPVALDQYQVAADHRRRRLERALGMARKQDGR